MMLARIAVTAAKIAAMLTLPCPWRQSKQVAADAADAGGSGRGDQNELRLMLMMLARISVMPAKIAAMLALPFPWRLSKQVAG